MPDDPPRLQVLHLADDPNDSFLLAEELAEGGITADVRRACTADELRTALDDPCALIVADLPLPFSEAEMLLASVQATRLDLPVIYRWGTPGLRSSEAPAEQLIRSVQRALATKPDRRLSDPERRAVLDSLARYQNVFLELSRDDHWDGQTAIRRVTAAAAKTLNIERVSVWELGEAKTLVCLDLYERSRDAHVDGELLAPRPRYMVALESCLTLAAHDARNDPRTSEYRDDYLDPLGITSMLDAPIRCNGRLAGVLCLEHVGEPMRRFSVLEQCSASSLANLLGRIFVARDRRVLVEQLAAHERLETVGRLAAGAAHDFNNLLTAILGYADAVEMDLAQNPRRAKDSLRQLRRAAGRARSLTRELLTVGSRHALSRVKFDLRDFVRDSESLLRTIAGVRVDIDLEIGATPVWVDADLALLERVLLNLVTNACDAIAASDHESGTVTIEVTSVVLTTALERLPAGAHPAIVVTDDGVGMDAATRERMCDPYFTTKADGVGTGLGMAAVRGIVEQHGGALRVSSEPGHGTRVEIVLPELAPARDAAAEPG